VEIHKAAEAVAANVKKFRLERGWTQGELAERLTAEGYPTSLKQVSNTEIGARQVDSSDLFAFKIVFNVSADDMYGVDPVPPELVKQLKRFQDGEKTTEQMRIQVEASGLILTAAREQVQDIRNGCRELLPDDPKELKELILEVKASHGSSLANTLAAIAKES
jgi:transcriptional regulator with XRE-family HTH domain